MAEHFGPYEFRYQAERERFYEDVEDFYADYGEKNGPKKQSTLRFIFEIGEHTSGERKKSVETGQFRGIRQFADLEALERFLTSERQGGSGVNWSRKSLSQYSAVARWARYVRKASRITHEETLAFYDIQLFQL